MKRNAPIDEDNFIDILDDRDIDYWMKMLGLSAKTLVKAVGIVGPDARAVRKWMKKNDPKKKPSIFKRIFSFVVRKFKADNSRVLANQS